MAFKRKRTYTPRRKTYSKRQRVSYTYKPRPKTRRYRKKSSSMGSVARAVVNYGTKAAGAAMLKYGVPALQKISGFGDYTVGANTIATDTVPQFSNKGRGMRVCHREYVQDIVGGAANTFTVQAFPINPGLPNLFPWLSSIAQQFEQYIIHGMVLEFKSMSSDALNNVNTTLGTLIMATQYDALDAAFQTKQQMENYEFAASVKPSHSLMHPIECAKDQSPLHVMYVRTPSTVLPTSSDIRLYDYATTYIATSSLPGSNTNIGEYWVTYDIEFLKPKQQANSDFPLCLDQLYIQSSATVGPTTVAPLGVSAFNTFEQNTFGCSILAPSNYIAFPPFYRGDVLITYAITAATAAGCTAPTIINVTGCAQVPAFNGAPVYGSISGSSTSCCFQYMFRCSGVQIQRFTMSAATGIFPTGTGIGILTIVPTIVTFT